VFPNKVYINGQHIGNVLYNNYQDFEVEVGKNKTDVKMEDLASSSIGLQKTFAALFF
jgi:hypothetical protein